MIKWHIETRKIKDLKDYAKNPRQLSQHDAAHLQKSLERFGLIDKPCINQDGTLIGGHQRKKILKKLGYKEIEVLVPDRQLDDKEIEELNIRLNKNTGEFDFDVLANEFDFADLLNWGFDSKELLDEIGQSIDPTSEEEKEQKKNEISCPNCGHLFEKP